MKAYFGVCVIKGINNLPKIAYCWSSDIFVRNKGIKQTMTKNGLKKFANFHLNNSNEETSERLYKCWPTLTSVLRNVQRCYSLGKKILLIRE